MKVTDSYECASLWQVFNQNGLAAFPAVAAEALHADYQVIATSGSGHMLTEPPRVFCCLL